MKDGWLASGDGTVLLSPQDVMETFDINADELKNVVFDGGLIPYKRFVDREFINGTLQHVYEPLSFRWRWGNRHQESEYRSGIQSSFFFKKSDVEYLFSDARRWEALRDSGHYARRKLDAINVVLLKCQGKTHKEILEEYFNRSDSEEKDIITKLKAVAQEIANSQTPPLKLPPWSSHRS